MKKCIVFLWMLLLLCSLAACGADKPVDGENHLDWVWVRDYITTGAISESGYYYVENNILRYADFTVGANTVLCATAGCSHKDQSCDAYIPSTSIRQLLYWNEQIYYFDLFEPILYSRDATGLSLKKIATAASQYMEERKAIKIGSFVAAGGYLYYEVDISDKVVISEGVETTQLVMQSIGRINLTTGKDEIVYEEKIENPADEKLTLCAAREKIRRTPIMPRNGKSPSPISCTGTSRPAK